MKNTIYQTLTLALLICIICAIDCLVTSLYWQHTAIVHHAAFFEASSWGNVSFHWNDDSFAQAPFQDGSFYENATKQAFQNKLNSLGIK
jgi:hypothetical protein